MHQLAGMFALGGRRRWSRGEAMFRQAEPQGMFFKIITGVVAVHRTLADGRRQIVTVNTAGESCGYLERNGAYAFGGDAVSDVEACAFDRRRFDAFAARHGQLSEAVNQALSDKLRQTGELVAAIGQLRSEERVAYFLLRLAGTGPRRPEAQNTLTLHLTREQIADYLGLTIETVSRSFSRLKSERVIALSGTDIVAILDRERLARYAAFGQPSA